MLRPRQGLQCAAKISSRVALAAAGRNRVTEHLPARAEYLVGCNQSSPSLHLAHQSQQLGRGYAGNRAPPDGRKYEGLETLHRVAVIDRGPCRLDVLQPLARYAFKIVRGS